MFDRICCGQWYIVRGDTLSLINKLRIYIDHLSCLPSWFMLYSRTYCVCYLLLPLLLLLILLIWVPLLFVIIYNPSLSKCTMYFGADYIQLWISDRWALSWYVLVTVTSWFWWGPRNILQSERIYTWNGSEHEPHTELSRFLIWELGRYQLYITQSQLISVPTKTILFISVFIPGVANLYPPGIGEASWKERRQEDHGERRLLHAEAALLQWLLSMSWPTCEGVIGNAGCWGNTPLTNQENGWTLCPCRLINM